MSPEDQQIAVKKGKLSQFNPSQLAYGPFATQSSFRCTSTVPSWIANIQYMPSVAQIARSKEAVGVTNCMTAESDGIVFMQERLFGMCTDTG